MIERDEYYKGQHDYPNLEKMRSLLLSHDISKAIGQLKNVNVHSYIRGIRNGEWYPLIYFACLKSEYADVVKALIRKGADFNKQPDADTYAYLPFVCHNLFLKTIAAKFRIPQDKTVLDHSIKNRLNIGDSKRLEHLLSLGILKDSHIKSYIDSNADNILVDTLKTMVGYLTYMYTIRSNNDQCNLTEETVTVILKFNSCLKFLISWGAPKTEDLLDYCIEHYLYEIIPTVMITFKTILPPVYHTQKNSTVTAVLRPLLNDFRYVETCKILGVVPDSDVFNYKI